MTDSKKTSDSGESDSAVKSRSSSERKSMGFKISKLFSGKMSSSTKLEVKTEVTEDTDNDDDHVSTQQFETGQRPVRKELLESNLDQEATHQKLKGERMTTQDKHRKLAKEEMVTQKRQQQASPRPETQDGDLASTTPSNASADSNPAFSVATKQPENKRHADGDDDDNIKLSLYESTNAAQGSKKKHRQSIDATSMVGDSSSAKSMSAAAAAAAAAADGVHDKRAWTEKWNVPQWVMTAAPAALAAVAVGASIYFVKSIVLRKR